MTIIPVRAYHTTNTNSFSGGAAKQLQQSNFSGNNSKQRKQACKVKVTQKSAGTQDNHINIVELRRNKGLMNDADDVIYSLGLGALGGVGSSDTTSSEAGGESDDPATTRIKERGKIKKRRSRKNKKSTKSQDSDYGDNKNCHITCKNCSGSDPEQMSVMWPHEHLGARYNNYGKNDLKFRQLEFRSLVAEHN